MKSDIPKVCHEVGGKTMIEHVVNTAKELNPKEIVVVVSKDNIKPIRHVLDGTGVRLQIQQEQLGTGHAARCAVPCCSENSDMLILLGDVPLIKPSTLKSVVSTDHDAVIMGFVNPDSDNRFGRIIVLHNRVFEIVEYADATPDQRNIKLCNSGMIWIKHKHLHLLSHIDNNNSKQEYYLTDIVAIMVGRGLEIGFLEASVDECMGVNTQQDLKRANKLYTRHV
jgi:bifunctional UDP-N-acetylglucosamine pyrophosphorylase/glucosamine-1-phosphate N-acetyltransferase